MTPRTFALYGLENELLGKMEGLSICGEIIKKADKLTQGEEDDLFRDAAARAAHETDVKLRARERELGI